MQLGGMGGAGCNAGGRHEGQPRAVGGKDTHQGSKEAACWCSSNIQQGGSGGAQGAHRTACGRGWVGSSRGLVRALHKGQPAAARLLALQLLGST